MKHLQHSSSLWLKCHRPLCRAQDHFLIVNDVVTHILVAIVRWDGFLLETVVIEPVVLSPYPARLIQRSTGIRNHMWVGQ